MKITSILLTLLMFSANINICSTGEENCTLEQDHQEDEKDGDLSCYLYCNCSCNLLKVPERITTHHDQMLNEHNQTVFAPVKESFNYLFSTRLNDPPEMFFDA